MHWQIGKGGGFHYAAAEARNEPLPVTVFLGGPPALILAAIAPLPENVPELMLASLIAGERLRLIEGLDQHPLVADAEFALMGQVRPHVRRPESGDGGGEAATGGLLHRRPAAGPLVALVPAGDAGRPSALVVRGDRVSLAGGGHRA
jgi:hypothetical protein